MLFIEKTINCCIFKAILYCYYLICRWPPGYHEVVLETIFSMHSWYFHFRYLESKDWLILGFSYLIGF